MTPPSCLVETFPALDEVPHCRAVFLAKQPDVAVHRDRGEAIQQLKRGHLEALQSLGLGELPVAEAEQIHSNGVALVGPQVSFSPYPGNDALITSLRGVCLKIFVADCAAVYLVDLHNRAIGLVHSGRKGTELGIVPATIQAMQKAFNILPQDLVIQISPCIRPPHYEVDFATHILQQAHTAGVKKVVDCGICTACHPERYYSYRMEKGKTGRMAAVLALT